MMIEKSNIWHPCAQMKDYESFPPLEIVSAQGDYIYTKDGRKVIDAISSWWCKSLGHGHPKILEAVTKQISKFEHVILANTTNEQIIELTHKLNQIDKKLTKTFFADSGSDAIEIAVKMALQYQQNKGEKQRVELMSLSNGYHGETLLTLSLGDCDTFNSSLKNFLYPVHKLEKLPYVNGYFDPKWHEPINNWSFYKKQLDKYQDTLAVIVIEPLVQGAGFMKMYQPDFLKKLATWCKKNDVLLIADEIMTGMGRLGEYMACHLADISPDIVAYSKGLTAGFSPFSVIMTSDEIYNVFYADYETKKAFMHSQTYCGNSVGVAASLATLKVYEEEQIFTQVKQHSSLLQKALEEIKNRTNCLTNIRTVGFVTAGELTYPDGQLVDTNQRYGYAVYQRATQLGALLRPIHNTFYLMPPLNMSSSTLEQIVDIASQSLKETLNRR